MTLKASNILIISSTSCVILAPKMDNYDEDNDEEDNDEDDDNDDDGSGDDFDVDGNVCDWRW